MNVTPNTLFVSAERIDSISAPVARWQYRVASTSPRSSMRFFDETMSNAGCEAGGMGANGGAWAGTVDMQHRNAEADRDARRDARGVDFARIIFRGALWSCGQARSD